MDGKIPPEVYATLRRTLDKLSLVGSITVDPAVQAQELTQSVGEEISRMIEQQKKLEKRFEELVSAQHVLRTLPNKSKLRENQAELQQVAEQLRQSTKQLCRNLKDNPNVAENMAKVATERQSLQLLLNNTLHELELFRKAQPLIESVMAMEAAEVKMRGTIEHERTTTSTVKQLRNDLKDEKIDHEEKTKEQKKLVFGLKEGLAEMKMGTAVEIRYLDKDSSAKNEHLRRLEQTQLEDMRRELVLVRQQTEIEANVHSATADFLRHMSAKMQEARVNWSARHDEDLANRDTDVEQLRANHARDTCVLRDMEEKHAAELRLKNEREMRNADDRDRSDLEVQRIAAYTKAAIIVQAYWRGYTQRKGAKGGKGKGGKAKAKPKKK
ncbi:hypothetical protein FOA52_007003 [Chlamydomonas sp. UWO 241]|nr:hypothetical protein FOA52_007003 [Chlamydomonas sp. UWO 241]